MKESPNGGRTQGGKTSKKKIKMRGKRKPVFPNKRKNISSKCNATCQTVETKKNKNKVKKDYAPRTKAAID